MKTKLFFITLFSLLFQSQASARYCSYSRESGFSVEGRSSGSASYQCSGNTPYFFQVNFTVEQGLNCTGSSMTFGGGLSCENRSHQTRDVNNVTLVCCDEQQF